MSGIACAGNWIVDNIKIIDTWPEQGELTTIRSTDHAIGGSSANVLTDLRDLGFPQPIFALGCIGDDAYGELVLSHCKSCGIDLSLINVIEGETTSYTDVMTVSETGDRTFFHHRGSNARFGLEHVDLSVLESAAPRIFHLGYLLLLDGMDQADDEYGTVASRLLSQVRQLGIQTSIDVVSEASDRFERIVRPALPHVDHCIVNDYEAERTTGVSLRDNDGILNRGAIAAATLRLLELGVNQTAVIHCPEGATYADARGRQLWVNSLNLPPETVVSSVGAGDAFCAGVLYGLHEGWEPEDCLVVGHGAAATSLGSKGATGGVKPLGEVRRFVTEYSNRA